MLVFIGTIGRGSLSESGFDTRARAAIAQCGGQDIGRILLGNGSVYHAHDGAAGPGDDIFTIFGKNQGLIAGKILSSDDYKPVQLDRGMIDELVADPQVCTTRFWGRYSGCVYNRRTKVGTLVRDPLGLSTLFYLVDGSRVIFSNHLHALYLVLAHKPSLDMHYFAEYAIGQSFAPERTPFEGISELQPGMGLRIDAAGNVQQELLWDLSSFKQTTAIDQVQYEQELYELIRRCFKGWFADSKGICLELSGGLDSSSVMIFLHDVFKDEKKVVGVNYFDSKTPSSNEIEHAQEVADACSFGLQFADWQDSSLLDPLPRGWYPNRPSTFLFSFGAAQQLSDIATAHNCSDIINGQGGDHVFLAPHPRKALADYWIDKGIWSSRAVLSELSSVNRAPWWSIVQDSLRDVGSYYGPGRINPAEAFRREDDPTAHLNARFADVVKDEPFYLDQYLKGFLPGKAGHIKSLFHAVSFADRNQRVPRRTFSHPLLFQPIVEHALRLPTYQSFAKGHDRMVVRNIASQIVPARALWRHIKGETTGSMCKSLAQHASKIEELLSEGQLVKQGLINKQWLENEITKVRHGASTNMWPLMNLLSAQLWINQWGL